MLLGTIITIALVGGLIYFIRHKTDRSSSNKPHKAHRSRLAQKKHANDKAKKTTKSTAFHCVETHHHGKCCEAVKALHGKRFLSAEAPILPIQGCDQAHCECDYVHHDDRRSDNRRTDVGLLQAMYGQTGEVEHRSGTQHGRRKTD
ncbi:MAG: hypothetical protein JKY50_11445 [Oleispira sp.]|nr:hypothetical protein [Oleispira sp.]